MAVLAPILAAALAAGPHPGVIVNPDWLKKPTGEDLEAHYPKLMEQMAIEGEVVVRCDVTIDGDAANCSVPFESPGGLGFGPAALSLTPLMKFTPKKVDGVAVAGGRMQTPIRFRLYGPAGGATASVMPPAGADAKARAQALRVVQLTDGVLFDRVVSRKLAQLEAEAPNDGDPASRKRMIDAYLTALRQLKPALDQIHTNLLLARLTPEQIAGALAFVDTPSGRTMVAKAADSALQLTATQSAEIQAFIKTNAGHAFIGAMNETVPVMGDQLDSQGPALAAAALKLYCAEPGACPVRDSRNDRP